MFKLLIISALAAVAVAQAQDKDAETLVYNNELNADGSYKWDFETTNGISAQEKGFGGQSAEGVSRYVSPEGEQIELVYVADAEGFKPSGRHLPVEVPAPRHVIEMLEFILKNPPKDDPNFNPQVIDDTIARLRSVQ